MIMGERTNCAGLTAGAGGVCSDVGRLEDSCSSGLAEERVRIEKVRIETFYRTLMEDLCII